MVHMAMKILALSDLHSEEAVIDWLRALSLRSSYDLVLFCGDITNRGPVSYAEEVLSFFPGKAYAVHGNMDTEEVINSMRQMGALIHGKKIKLREWNLVGLGGSNPTPFGTPSEASEEQLEAALSKAGVDEFSIVLSHAPPYGSFDGVGAMHVGSTAVRRMVEQKRPILLICGHIHEHEGKEIVGETLVVKLAPAQRLRAAEITINDGIDVKFISL